MSSRILKIIFLGLFLCGFAPAHASDTRPWATVKVQTGDTLSAISQRTNTPLQQLVENNRITNPDKIQVGQTLRIHPLPARNAEAHAHRQHRRSGESELWKTVRVRRNDTLWSIARKFNLKTSYLARINNLDEKGMLQPGTLLKVRKRRDQPLMEGIQLPDGEGYVRLRPKRSWGTVGTIRIIQHVYREFMTRYPDSPPGYIGDLSRRNGGYLPPHVSHQKGTDVDVSYYKKNNKRTRGLEVVTAQTIDIEKTWELIRLFLNTGHTTAIFMDHKLQGVLHEHLVKLGYGEKMLKKTLQYPRPIAKRRGIIRHSPGHHHHLHIRFDCVKPTDPCTIATTERIAARTPATQTHAPAAASTRRARRMNLAQVPAVLVSTPRRLNTFSTEARPTRRKLSFLPTPVLATARLEENVLTRKARHPIETHHVASSVEPEALPLQDGYLRIVRAQDFEPTRARLESPASRIERHWLEVLKAQQATSSLWSNVEPGPLDSRTAEDSKRSGRLGPSVQSNLR